VIEFVAVTTNSNHSVLPEEDIAVLAPSKVIVFFILILDILVGCLVVHPPCTELAHDILDLPLFCFLDCFNKSRQTSVDSLLIFLIGNIFPCLAFFDLILPDKECVYFL